MERNPPYSRLSGFFILGAFLFAGGAWAFSGSGTGTETSPYVITDATQLQEMNDDFSAHYILGNDIDASGTVSWNGGSGFVPVGGVDKQFSGFLDGQGYTVTSLTVNRPTTNFVGLFGLTHGATIENVGMEGGNISGDLHVGGMVGFNDGGTVSNCYVTCAVRRRK
jgi:hypothetical protein